MAPWAGMVVVSFVLAACSAGPPTPPIVVQSEQFPQVEIECRGEVGLTEEDCRHWGEVMLPAAPTRPAGGQNLEVAKIVLTYRTGDSRCAADYLNADGRTVMTTAAACPQNDEASDQTAGLPDRLRSIGMITTLTAARFFIDAYQTLALNSSVTDGE